jgi:S-ribosylhomocysteine lyase LuxS involved in autoinducer biosynthesis
MYQWIAELPNNYQIPGATEAECGNYSDHSLVKAREDAQKFFAIIQNKKHLGEYVYL